MERSLIIVKPDAVQRGLIGEILRRLEQRGLRFIGLKLMWIDRELAERHYAEHRGKAFFEELLSFITSGPVVVGVVEGPRAIEVTRKTMGKTDPAEAEPGTIRGDLALSIAQNVIHGSDSPEKAAYEISLFFREDELVSYERAIDRWIMG
ncbi:nucleoside-diphosphate kinase [Thermomicrobium sp. 4228-Ro]|uniref:nucleoside-diphosphate kinase n=1 Tax=Thermomicrobium sp. 4228-Ro TaxID=2993937 RepID=UPI0022495955|nr:nucleoside-diphosphate kinase [Thermomicrobium sp. 4228-Ro]MCX2726919.1 nucleoside-diphosphate kinase [Thermomicrobium sp. 4228-Ro]